MRLLNLGCGTKTSDCPGVVNIDWSLYLRIRQNPVLRLCALPLLSAERREKLSRIPSNVMVFNLARGIPFPAGSVDAVYHSHLLEHLDRDVAPLFIREIKRVLKPAGIMRVVVPDFEYLCREYLGSLERAARASQYAKNHDEYVGAVLEQCVRKMGKGTAAQNAVRRWIEKVVLGDARRRGETHQWMYDRVNLVELLGTAGFERVSVMDYQTSNIPRWADYRLDLTDKGDEYKPHSLYVEAHAPSGKRQAGDR